MDPIYVAVALVVIGLILIIAEANVPGGFLLIPGVDMLVIGVYGLIFPNLLYTWVTPILAVILTIPVVVGTLTLYKRLADNGPPSTTVTSSLIGKTGKVTVETVPGTLKGKVKIGSDVWSADSDETIPVGVQVIVESSEGVHVHVKRN